MNRKKKQRTPFWDERPRESQYGHLKAHAGSSLAMVCLERAMGLTP